MAEVIAQTYQDPDGTLHYVYYDPDTGQYRDVSMSDAYNVGSSFLPPPETDYAAPPTPDTPPVDPGPVQVQGENQPAIMNVTDSDGNVYQQNMLLDPATNQWVPVYDAPAVGTEDNVSTADPSTTDTTAGASGGYYDSSGYYHSGSGYSGGSSGGGYSSSGYSSGSSGMDNLRAARQMQTDWIAQHTQPGGGSSSQKTASVPGGASAGAWGATSAPPVHSSYSGGGGSSGGGGGQIGGVIRSIRGNILGNLGGMFGGGGSSYSSYHPSKPAPPPKPFTPPDPQMHGFARPYDYLNAQASVFSHPEWLIPRAVGVPTTSGEYGQLANLPMGPLAKLMADSRSRKPNNPGPFINTAARMYDQIANSPAWFDPNRLMRTLLHPKTNSALGVDFGKGTPPLTAQDRYNKQLYGSAWIDPRDIYQAPGAGPQADEMKGYLGAINTIRYGSKYGAAVNDWDQRVIDDWGGRNIRRKPGGGQSLPAYLRGRV